MEWWTGSRSTRGRALRKRGRTNAVSKDGHVPRRRCPQCRCKQTRRSRQWHLWEWLLRLIRLYPFRCESCKHRFLRFSLYGR
jgi:hypothetical protein